MRKKRVISDWFFRQGKIYCYTEYFKNLMKECELESLMLRWLNESCFMYLIKQNYVSEVKGIIVNHKG